jgi:hypothetical protein
MSLLVVLLLFFFLLVLLFLVVAVLRVVEDIARLALAACFVQRAKTRLVLEIENRRR